MSKLIGQAILGFLALAVAMGAALFLPAGTLAYWQAWVYLAVFLGSAAAISIYLARNDPALLQRRVNAGPTAEQERSQQVIQALASLAFVSVLVVSSLDHRFGWSSVPIWTSLLSEVLVLLGFVVVFFVFRENSYTAATIQVAQDQRVISTGPYAVVRHPMYAGAGLLMVATPPALGSWWGLLAVAVLMAAIIVRLFDEERFLYHNLAGYKEYRERVRYRLVPYVW
jgi:protein-S-isoprenylcysteine O-methyltransferase Ste14